MHMADEGYESLQIPAMKFNVVLCRNIVDLTNYSRESISNEILRIVVLGCRHAKKGAGCMHTAARRYNNYYKE